MSSFQFRPALALLLLLAAVAWFRPARAETFQTCAGFITALPAVIETQGVWCLDRDLSTAIASGSAIHIQANNVTIDCNGFKVGGLAAGDASLAFGIFATQRNNVTVRNCGIRGFLNGIYVNGGAGHLVEDNRLDNNLRNGIDLYAEGSIVRRNRVFDTGGTPDSQFATGIYASADLVDNVVDGVFATAAVTYPYGIHASGTGSLVRGNRIRGLVVAGAGTARGIYASHTCDGCALTGNVIAAAAAVSGVGIQVDGTTAFCSGNRVANYGSGLTGCRDAGGNDSF